MLGAFVSDGTNGRAEGVADGCPEGAEGAAWACEGEGSGSGTTVTAVLGFIVAATGTTGADAWLLIIVGARSDVEAALRDAVGAGGATAGSEFPVVRFAAAAPTWDVFIVGSPRSAT